MQDDIMMNTWNFSRLNRDKIWYGVSFRHAIKDHPLGKLPASWDPNFDKSKTQGEFFNYPRDAWWGWFSEPFGLPLVEQLVAYHLAPQDLAILERNLGRGGRVGMVCDMFYIPQTVREDAIRLGHIFQDVFCEIAIPMMLSCLDNFKNWEILRGVWAYNALFDGDNNDVNKALSEYPAEADWVHAFKFSQPFYRDLAQELMNQHSSQ